MHPTPTEQADVGGRRLSAGDRAPAFTATALSGERVAIPAAPPGGGHVLLSLLRYASCPMCNLRVRELERAAADLAAHGVRPVVVMHSPAFRIRRHAASRALPFPVVADPARRFYRLYGAGTSWVGILRTVLLPSFYAAFAKATVLGYWGGAVDGHFASMPAEFLIGPDGVVQLAKYGRDIGDHLSVGEVLAAAARRGAAASAASP